uniref:hypothetical protein n=1 Tax=Candidatus Electrothrix sp. TaxID=2170559 RepID=UPI004055B35C
MGISKPHLSNKHEIIKKANVVIFAAVAVAVFLVIFGLFAGRALISQAAYNQRVIDAKKEALELAKDNSDNASDLEESYLSFESEPINVLGGNPNGEGPLDGSNPKIVLDALPSVYDYPALSSSIEKILLDNSYQIDNIGGAEDPSLAASNPESNNDSSDGPSISASESTATEIPYSLSITSTVDGSENLLRIFERSIRPFYVEALELSGTDQSLSVEIRMNTFYKPGISFQTSSEVVD